MGKKTKDAKKLKAHRERFNNSQLMPPLSLAGAVPGRLSTANVNVCLHGDPAQTHWAAWSMSEREKWRKIVTNIANYGQRYAILSTFLSPNEVPLNYASVFNVQKNEFPMDDIYVKVAYASAATECVTAEDYELARIKLELAICSEPVAAGIDSNTLADYANAPHRAPEWFREMYRTLERVRASKYHTIIYLATKVPCHCLDQAVEEAHAALAANPLVGVKAKCEHGKPTGLPDSWYHQMETDLRSFFSPKKLKDYASPRDFDRYSSLLSSKPEWANTTFVRYAFSMAGTFLCDDHRFEPAEVACNIALMANVYAMHGEAKVKGDIQKMKDTKEMEPYLRELYLHFRHTANITGTMLKFLDHQLPCDCVGDIQAIFRAEGDQRSIYCDNCDSATTEKQIKICSGCGIERYCGESCQKNDYPRHKDICKLMKRCRKHMVGDEDLEKLAFRRILPDELLSVEPGTVMQLQNLQSKADWNKLTGTACMFW